MAQNRSVTFVSRKWPPAMGGMETYSLKLCQALDAHLQVHRLVLPGRADGSVPSAGALLAWGLRTGLGVLTARKPTAILHVADVAIWPLALMAVMRSRRCQVLISAHGTDIAYGLRGGLRGRGYSVYVRLGARLLRRACLVANSAATAQRAARLGFRDIRVVPLAAEVSPPVSAERSGRLLFSGRLVERKGLSWFVRNVLPELPAEIGLDVAGTIWNAAEARALTDPRVRFLGHLQHAALMRAYAGALCVVVPNLVMPNGEYEGFGLVAVEGAAAGGLVLAAAEGGLTDAVMDGQTGFLLPPGDAASWLRKIHEILTWSEETRAGFVAEARSLAQRHYSWDRVARDMAALYGGLAPEGSAP
ncbi:MAG: glycosyltransferase family 4 protein [Pseudomonadota bacterium]